MKMSERQKGTFSETDQMLAGMSRVLAHPARIAILRILARKQHCVCGELVSDLPLAQSTVSQHLRELREAGFIRGEIDGPHSCYTIDRTNLKRFFQELGAFEQEIETDLDHCC